MGISKSEAKKILEMPTIGYWSELCGVEVKAIEHGVDDYVVCVSNAFIGGKTCHRVRVLYTHTKDSKPYIVIDGVKLYLRDCVRTRV